MKREYTKFFRRTLTFGKRYRETMLKQSKAIKAMNVNDEEELYNALISSAKNGIELEDLQIEVQEYVLSMEKTINLFEEWKKERDVIFRKYNVSSLGELVRLHNKVTSIQPLQLEVINGNQSRQ